MLRSRLLLMTCWLPITARLKRTRRTATLTLQREDWRLVSSQVAERFPAYGYYPVADPAASPGEAAMTGDAIDDLLDITLAMREVVWRAENLGVADAVWYFRLDYFHWGRHARELALYLHARQFS